MALVHTYLGYDPVKFGSPHEGPPDLVSGAMEHLLAYGKPRRFTPEELANAIRIDPSQIRGLGPSLDALIELLEARRRKILETYETERVRRLAADAVRDRARTMTPPAALAAQFEREVREEQLKGLERIWERLDEETPFARELLRLVEDVGAKYEVDQLASRWHFTGREPLDIPKAIEVKEELEEIERLLKQLREALKNARLAIIDLDSLSRFAPEESIEGVRDAQRRVNELLERLAREQGFERDSDSDGSHLRLTPRAMRIYQSRLLERIFGELQASRSGRHQGRVVGEGAVELPTTRPYAFGDSMAHADLPQTMINALLRRSRESGPQSGPTSDHTGPVRFRSDDLEIHRTRNVPKCATVVILDMSGSMRYAGQYLACKRMALALDGLIRREYPGDSLQFVEVYTLAKLRAPGEIPELMPKPVSIFQPVVRLRADMSDPSIVELDLPLHFTNIERALHVSRTLLAARDTPNRQIFLLTDGLPTAHFEGSDLYMLYPPDPRTEEWTLRQAKACQREGITINVFLLPSWNQSEEDVRFAHRLAEQTGGRVLFTAGEELDRFVIWDYLSRRRSIIG